MLKVNLVISFGFGQAEQFIKLITSTLNKKVWMNEYVYACTESQSAIKTLNLTISSHEDVLLL